MVVVPTIAQEALGRTAVEAMGVGRPVVASRLGGLPFTVVDGATGLLCEPGNPDDLARKLEILLDDPGLRERLDGSAGGEAGRSTNPGGATDRDAPSAGGARLADSASPDFGADTGPMLR